LERIVNRQQAILPQPNLFRRITRTLLVATSLLGWFGLDAVAPVCGQQAEVDEAMAKYADAANFQTGGAFDLSIEARTKFLADYPKHPMAAQAAHYLGVCYMQKENPDYRAAAKSFRRALQLGKYDLRQESLANLGWCLYATAGEGESRDTQLLKESMDAFRMLRDENPESKFLDRAHFYSGEAAYGLGDAKLAIEFYDKLLSMADAKSSPLRCDAMYARGVAQEDLKQIDAAIASYRQLLSSCDREELITDVHLRIGDLWIMQRSYPEAIKAFEQAFDSTNSAEDRSYALFRQAFALVQADRPGEAASKYEQILTDFPQSPYAASAVLAGAQSSYRSGDLDGAAERFRRVLEQNNRDAATEAAHWLARIEIGRGNPAEAARMVQQQLDRGIEGDFALDLRLDLAEALSMDPNRIEESLQIFTKAYRDAPDDPLAPRALYNAAFSLMQLNRPQEALELATEFIAKFPDDTLVADVRFVAAESQLLLGKPAEASDTYQQLLTSTSAENPQRALWLLRAAASSNAAAKFEVTIDRLTAEINSFQQPAQKAEAYLLIGQAQLRGGQPEAAVKSLAASRKAEPTWGRSGEAQLLEGQALLRSGKAAEAEATWKELATSRADQPIADQARYQLAQLASTNERFDEAVGFYEQILNTGRESALTPHAQYGRSWALMQSKQYAPALESLNLLLKNESHPLRNDALLARGISLRNLERYGEARADLEQYLKIPPTGINLGHALYELALIDQVDKQPEKAAEKLSRLVQEVGDYPGMDKVLYELGWSLQECGKNQEAITHFTSLIGKYPDAPNVADAAYFIGQQHYNAEQWNLAASQFEIAIKKAADAELSEKALYRLGWSQFKDANYEAAERAFADQSTKHPDGKFVLDALMMAGECRFKQNDYQAALAGFQIAREAIQRREETSKNVRDEDERRVRELILLHGGQSAAQLKSWKESIEWYDELRQRFPSSEYLPQVFYETGFAHQQLGDNNNALKFYQEVADNYRSELAARARFMIGEIHFANRDFDKAIPEFQRVMFGFNAEKAPDAIRNWQAKSGFEAGRCGELLLQGAKSPESRQKAIKIAREFFNYVIEKHPNHELAAQSRNRIEALQP
jgi:TolA-binding protein